MYSYLWVDHLLLRRASAGLFRAIFFSIETIRVYPIELHGPKKQNLASGTTSDTSTLKISINNKRKLLRALIAMMRRAL